MAVCLTPFLNTYISQDSVAICVSFVGIFNYDFIANLVFSTY